MYTASLALAFAAVLPSVLAGGKLHTVEVGPNGKFVYEPPFIHAQAHDTVQFKFNPKNHTVTESLFDPPCVPKEGGFKSGFIPVAPGAYPQHITYHLPAHYKGEPLWFYCGQGNHCGQGMVFAINPPDEPSDKSFKDFQDLAIERNGSSSAAPPSTPTAGAEGTYDDPAQNPWAGYHTATVVWGPGTPTATDTAAAADHTVLVGPDGKLVYEPAHITAKPGETVLFEFRAKNHTVTQSSFENPCVGLLNADGTPGFKSGFQPVPAGATSGFPTFTVKINDTHPIYGYCGQTGHCDAGMVFTINAPETGAKSFHKFHRAARHRKGN